MRKILSVFVSLLVFLTQANFANAATFSDVEAGTHYNGAIEWMSDNNIIIGYSDGKFRPDQCVARVELLKMIDELLHSTKFVPYSYSESFSDVSRDEWYYDYLVRAYNRSIVEGYPDNTFRPAKCVNRVEAMKIALLSFHNNEVPYIDVTSLTVPNDMDENAWYYDYFAYLYMNNLIGREHISLYGGEDGYDFYPDEPMTRKEAAEMLYRMKVARDMLNERYEIEAVPAKTVPAYCEILGDGWKSHSINDDVNLSFCYKEEWGNPEYERFDSSKSQNGTWFKIDFKESGRPIIDITSLDYQVTGDFSPGPGAHLGIFFPWESWEEINFDASESEIKSNLDFEDMENLTVEKVTINDVQALKIHDRYPCYDYCDNDEFEALNYYVGATMKNNNWNIQINGDPENDNDVQKFVDSIMFCTETDCSDQWTQTTITGFVDEKDVLLHLPETWFVEEAFDGSASVAPFDSPHIGLASSIESGLLVSLYPGTWPDHMYKKTRHMYFKSGSWSLAESTRDRLKDTVIYYIKNSDPFITVTANQTWGEELQYNDKWLTKKIVQNLEILD